MAAYNNNDKRTLVKAASNKVLPPLNQSSIELNDNDNQVEADVKDGDDVKRCD